MEKLFNNQLLSDITLEIEDKQIFAHRAILYQIPYFERLFSNNMKDCKSTIFQFSTKNSKLTYNILYAFIQFVYNYPLKLPENMSLLDIVEATELFMFKPFILYVFNAYIKNIQINVLPINTIHRILIITQNHIKLN